MVLIALIVPAVGAQPAVSTPKSANNSPYHPSQTTGMVRFKDKGYFLSLAKWEKLNIPVCWEPGTPQGVERGWVEDAVRASWQAHSKLVFNSKDQQPWPTCAANAVGIRIAVRDDGQNDGPHTMDLGKFIDAKPAGMVLNFTFQTWSPSCADNTLRKQCIISIAVHEFGHAIGFAHEQNRPDTPGECTQPPQGRNGDTMLTPWDPHSVMNYCNSVYNNNGVLSEDDIKTLRHFYGE